MFVHTWQKSEVKFPVLSLNWACMFWLQRPIQNMDLASNCDPVLSMYAALSAVQNPSESWPPWGRYCLKEGFNVSDRSRSVYITIVICSFHILFRLSAQAWAVVHTCTVPHASAQTWWQLLVPNQKLKKIWTALASAQEHHVHKPRSEPYLRRHDVNSASLVEGCVCDSMQQYASGACCVFSGPA